MERASGSVREICPSGVSSNWARDGLQTPHLLPDPDELLLDPGDLRCVDPMRLLPVDPVHLREIPAGALLQMFHPELYLAGREVPVPVVHRLELAAVDGDEAAAEDPLTRRQSSTKRAQAVRIAALFSLRKSAIVLWSRASRPVSHMTSTMAPRLPFQAPARGDTVEVAVDEELQEHRRLIARPPRPRGRRALETGFLKVESIDKRINDTNRICRLQPTLQDDPEKARSAPDLHPR